MWYFEKKKKRCEMEQQSTACQIIRNTIQCIDITCKTWLVVIIMKSWLYNYPNLKQSQKAVCNMDYSFCFGIMSVLPSCYLKGFECRMWISLTALLTPVQWSIVTQSFSQESRLIRCSLNLTTVQFTVFISCPLARLYRLFITAALRGEHPEN